MTDMNNKDLEQGSTEANRSTIERFAEEFKKNLFGDDLDGFMKLVDRDAVWTFMATGEQFHGIDEIRKAAERAMAGRIHTKDLHMELTNTFSGEDQFCIEYLHKAIMPEHSTITGSPPAGTVIAVPICITMHVSNGKLDRLNEYMDFATLTGVKKKLFS